jgi:hypothetical protein
MKLSMRLGILAATAFTAYVVAVIATGLGWNPLNANWKFENSGQFGDSFGPLGALMSAIAAVSALMAYWSQREELDRVKESAVADKIAMEKRDFEGTFFNLLNLFRKAVSNTDIGTGDTIKSGQDAFQRVVTSYFRNDARSLTEEDLEYRYKEMYKKHGNDLGHYFRLLYHIIRHIHESDIENKMFYVRIVRATLSSSELILLGLNGKFGGGVLKFAPLIEQYAILHNISADQANRLHLTRLYKKGAFGDRTIGKDYVLSE